MSFRRYLFSLFLSAVVLVTSMPGAGALFQARMNVPTAAAGGDITSNLSLWWKLDDNSGTTATDSGSSGRNGTFNNDGANDGYSTDPDWDASTKMIGTSCLYLCQFVDSNWVSNTTSWTLSGTVTVAGWVRPESATTLGGIIAIVGDSTNSKVVAIRRGDSSSSQRLVVQSTGSSSVYIATMSNGTWYHYAVVCTNGTVSAIYLNGSLASGTSSSLGLIPVRAGVHLGDDPSSPGSRYSVVKEDDFRIYGRGLVAADVTALYAYR